MGSEYMLHLFPEGMYNGYISDIQLGKSQNGNDTIKITFNMSGNRLVSTWLTPAYDDNFGSQWLRLLWHIGVPYDDQESLSDCLL